MAETGAPIARALINHYPKWISVLCPRGHVLTARNIDRSYAGSSFAASLGAHAARLPNVFDRLAAKCSGHGCPGDLP